MSEAKKKYSFRLSDNDIAYLRKLAIPYGGNTTRALEKLIENARDAGDTGDNSSDDRVTTGDAENMTTIPTDVLEDYRGQLAVKDDQIAALSQALIKAQDSNTELTRSLQAAQTLNAMDKPQTQSAAILEQSNETEPTAQPPIGQMTFRQVWRLWRRQRKE